MKRDNSLRKSSVIYINYMPRYTCCGIYTLGNIFWKEFFWPCQLQNQIYSFSSRCTIRARFDQVRIYGDEKSRRLIASRVDANS